MPEQHDSVSADFFRLEDLFTLTAAAVVEMQREFDDRLNPDYLSSCEVRAHQRLFSLPQADVRYQFGLVIDHATSTWRLLPWKKNEQNEQLHTHQLRYTLAAVPEPPAAPALNPAAPAPPIPLYLREPYFLLLPAEETDLCGQLTAVLSATDPHGWVSAVPGSAPGSVKELDQKLVQAEAKKINDAFANKTSERGMVFFRYADRPTAYLVVRVTAKSHNDSVFMFTPGKQPAPVTIYSLEGDDTTAMRYGPLHRLALNIRRWLQGDLPAVRTRCDDLLQGPAPLQLGLAFLPSFVESMRAGYAAGLAYLSGPAGSPPHAEPASVWPIFYDLTDVLAELRYSVDYKADDPQFHFGRRTTVDDETIKGDATADGGSGNEDKLIESRVVIRAERRGRDPDFELELQAPEFVLSGTALETFLASAQSSVDEISQTFAAGDAAVKRRYASYLMDIANQRNVVALLSYRGKTPKEEFLVVWPGLYQGKVQEFVFTCKRKQAGATLTDVKVVMRIEQTVAEVKLGTSATGLGDDETFEEDLADKQYQAFHNFFHAVRIWRARINPARGGAN